MRSGVAIVALVLTLSSCSAPFESALPPASSTSTSVPESAADAPAEPSSTSTNIAPAESTTSSTSSVAPGSIPLAGEPTGAALPDGMSIADLPEDPADRLGVMSAWLEATYPDRTSGHAYSFFGDVFDLTFNVNIAEEAEARSLCPFFTELTSLYLHDTEHSVNLNGWILSDSGYFEEAEWDRFGC